MGRLDKLVGFLRDGGLGALLGLIAALGLRSPGTLPAPPAAPPADVPVMPPPVPPPPPPKVSTVDPVKAICRLIMPGAECTATVLADRPGPGRYHVLSAHHCVENRPSGAKVTLFDGRTFPARVIRTNATADLALLEIEAPDGLPGAQIADSEPSRGAAVWHQGNGVHRPGNRETGNVRGGPNGEGMLSFRLSVSAGDSGAGIFRQEDNRLVAVVCCYGPMQTYGGSVTAIRRLVQGACGPEGCR